MLGEVLGVERRPRWSEDKKPQILSEVGVGGAPVTQCLADAVVIAIPSNKKLV